MVINDCVDARYGIVKKMIPMIHYPNSPKIHVITPIGLYNRTIGSNVGISYNVKNAYEEAICNYWKLYIENILKNKNEVYDYIYIGCAQSLSGAKQKVIQRYALDQINTACNEKLWEKNYKIFFLEDGLALVESSNICLLLKEHQCDGQKLLFYSTEINIKKCIDTIERNMAAYDVMRQNGISSCDILQSVHAFEGEIDFSKNEHNVISIENAGKKMKRYYDMVQVECFDFTEIMKSVTAEMTDIHIVRARWKGSAEK